MIFVWIRTALIFILKLFIPPRSGADPHISPKMKCQVCGGRDHKMEYIEVSSDPAKQGDAAVRVGLVQMTCRGCGAISAYDPLYKKTGGRQVTVDHIRSATVIRGISDGRA